MALTGILFDLDGTLLDIDIDRFLDDYFGALGPVVADVIGDGVNSVVGLKAVVDSTSAMIERHPLHTNREVFNERFHELTGVNLDLEEFALPFERFYADVFPTLRGTIGPHAGARDVVRQALDLGLKVAIATNPIFPLSAIRERMRWAGVDDLAVHAVTSYENMHATKPSPAYYSETADMIGAAPTACLMVGDDPALDMGGTGIGMKTFYVGSTPIPYSDFTGSLRDLAALLPQLASETG